MQGIGKKSFASMGCSVYRRISRGLCLLFIFLVLGSIAWQVQWQHQMRSMLAVRDNMRNECTGSEIYDLLKEIKCFPVQEAAKGKTPWYFENGYGAERSYGGKRSHQGIDIMSEKNKRGCLNIRSVSDGVVEQIGWLELGGYRIGIRSESGFYYYYAHMDDYAEGMCKGKKVKAGEILGSMGDTGYGGEGTRGKFAVHLHFGIYRQVQGKEKSLNPYYLLKYVDSRPFKEDE